MKIGDIVIVRGLPSSVHKGFIVATHPNKRKYFISHESPNQSASKCILGLWADEEDLEPVNCSIGKAYLRYEEAHTGIGRAGIWDNYKKDWKPRE